MKKFISLLLAVVLICTSLPMYVGAEETTGGYKLDYDRIGEDTYKVYIIADKASLDIHELRVQYGDAEIVSYEWYKQFAEKYEGTVIADDVTVHKFIAFPCAFLSDIDTTDEKEYFGEVVVRISSVNHSISLLDETGTIVYDEIVLDMSTEWDGSTPRPIPDNEPQPTATWNPEWTPVPTEPPTETPELTPEPNYETGDVDGNGNINAQDALLVLKYAAKLGELSEAQFVAANVDDSENVNATDALNILKYAAKIIVRFVFDSEENIEVLKDYIKENGTVNENGNKELVRDYVALGDSEFSIEYDSFEYDEINNQVIYIYESVDADPINCLKFTITLKNTTDTSVEVEWKQVTDNGVVDLKGQSTIKNEEYSLDSNYEGDIDKSYLEQKVPEYNRAKKDIWTADMKNIYNGYVHAAFVSLEDYFSKTLIMYVNDIYKSYRYSDEKFAKVTALIYGIDYSIYESLQLLWDELDRVGTKEDVYTYISEYGDHNDYYATTYVEKNSDTEDIYYVMDIFHRVRDIPIIIYIQPYINRDVYIGAVIYKANGSGEYEISKELQTVISVDDIDWNTSYDYECVYPENGSISETEQKILDEDIGRMLMKVDLLLRDKTSVELMDFGFYNYFVN